MLLYDVGVYTFGILCMFEMKIKPNNYMTNEESSAKAHEIHHPTKL
jgi:hypothetical protein